MSAQLHHAYTETKSGFPLTKMTVCRAVFLTEGQAVSSSKNRTGKQSPYKLPDPSAHRPVGRFLPRCQSLPLSRTVKRSHLLEKNMSRWRCYVPCINTARKETRMQTVLLNTLFKGKLKSFPKFNWVHPEDINAEFKDYSTNS